MQLWHKLRKTCSSLAQAGFFIICSGDACKDEWSVAAQLFVLCVLARLRSYLCGFFRVNQVVWAAPGRKAPPASQ